LARLERAQKLAAGTAAADFCGCQPFAHKALSLEKVEH
jgi:hypothetical protein